MTDPGPQVTTYQSIGGESFNEVWQVIQGRSGFLWLATNHGLLRFDGYAIKRYSTANSGLTHQVIRGLAQDGLGFIWLITEGGGLSRFDPPTEQFMTFTHDANDSSTLDSDNLSSISLGAGHTLWIGSIQGINRFDLKTFKNTRLDINLNPVEQSQPLHIMKIFEDAQQRLWFAVEGKGLHLFEPKTGRTHFFQPDTADSAALASDYIGKIYQNPAGDIWIATPNHINRFDQGRFERFVLPLKNSNKDIKAFVISLFEDSDKRLWIGTMTNGVSVLEPDGKVIRNVKHESGADNTLNVLMVSDIIQDNSGSLWFASMTGGLIKLSREAMLFQHYLSKSDNAMDIMTLFHDSKGRLWFCSDQSLYWIEPGQQGFQLAAKAIGYITDIVEAVDGTLTLNVGGLGNFSYEPVTRQLQPYGQKHGVEGLAAFPNLYSLGYDQQNGLWVGLFKAGEAVAGLHHFDSDKGRFVQHLNDLTIPAMIAYREYIIIGSSKRGIKMYNRLSGEVFDIENEQHNTSNINTLYVDSDGRIWVGSGASGLVLLDPDKKQLSFVNMNDGLPSNSIHSIVEDHQGRLWLGTAVGIVMYDPVKGMVRTFNEKQGMRLKSLSNELAAVLPTGEIVMASSRGLVRFSPERLLVVNDNRAAADILFSDFRLFNQSAPLQSQDVLSPLAKTINTTSELTLSYTQYWFSLVFASANYNQTRSTRFTYKMQGLKDQWIKLDEGQRQASFNSLPAGQYTLMVKSGVSDGDWNEGFRSLKITVAPPWWQTRLSYFCYVAGLVAAAYLWYRHQTRDLKQRSEALEQGVKERTATINALLSDKQRLFANVSHEFRTPLTLILSPIESLLNDPKGQPIKNELSLVRRNGRRLLRMVDQLLEFAKLERQSDGETQSVSLKETLNIITSSFLNMAQDKQLKLTVEDFDDVTLTLLPDSLNKILLNIVSNAIKYTKANGSIDVSVCVEGKVVHIAVKDSGIGICESDRKGVFERFNRVTHNHGEAIAGAGIGLALVKELVEANQGVIKLVSELGVGTTFTVTLPIATEGETASQQVLVHTSEEMLELEIDSIVLPEADHPPVMETAFTEQQKCILIVDDNSDLRHLLCDQLGRDYHCLSAANGQDGLVQAFELIPDLVISDIMMPVMDGYQLTEKLKGNELTSHIPVILLTAKGGVDSRLKGLQLLVDDYLAKPFNVEELRLRVRNILAIRDIVKKRYSEAIDGNINDKSGDGLEFDGVHGSFYHKVNEQLLIHFRDCDYNMKSLCEALGVSERQLQRKLKNQFDVGFTELVRNYRLNKASELLSSGFRGSQVYDEVGFSSHSYFSSCFKAKFGVTPKTFMAH